MGILITLTRAPFRVKSPKGSLLFLCGEDFSGFFSELFLGAITTVVAIITVITITTATLIIITITIITIVITIAIGGTPIKVNAFPFGEIF